MAGEEESGSRRRRLRGGLGRARGLLRLPTRRGWTTFGVVGTVAVSILGGAWASVTGSGTTEGAPCAGTPSDELAVPSSDDPVVRFAPLVFLHPRERYFPISAACYLEHSALVFAPRAGGVRRLLEPGAIEAERLGGSRSGSAPYAVTESGDPCEADPCVTSSAFTRPYLGTHLGAPGRHGFYLDAEPLLAGGSPSVSEGPIFGGTPAYYELAEDGSFVTYWFFYGFSRPGALFTRGRSHPITHEGDWESISVRLEDGAPVAVAYFEHGAPLVVPWNSVPRLDTHPLVFSARESHASYASQGPSRREILDRVLSSQIKNADETKVGLLWPTWTWLVDARSEAWYGFGGAWGALGPGGILSTLAKDRTGPLGPSAFKCPAPGEWLPPERGCLRGRGLAPAEPTDGR